jgi:hypothetical protein
VSEEPQSPSTILPLTGGGGAACRDGGGSSGHGWGAEKPTEETDDIEDTEDTEEEEEPAVPLSERAQKRKRLQQLEDLLNSGTLTTRERLAIIMRGEINHCSGTIGHYMVHS